MTVVLPNHSNNNNRQHHRRRSTNKNNNNTILSLRDGPIIQQQQQRQQHQFCRTLLLSSLSISWIMLLLLLALVVCQIGIVQAVHEVPTKKAIPPLMDPPPMLPEITDKVWMKIAIDDKEIGIIEFGLFGNNSPAAVNNFLTIIKCHPNKFGPLSKKPLCYKNTKIHRVIPNFAFQGGDITHNDGTGGECIYGGKMNVADDSKQQVVKFTRKHLLATAGTNMEFGSQFFVTTVKTQWLTGHHIAFGRVLNDENDVITQLEQVGTYSGKTKATITIMDTGVGTVTEEDRKPHY